MGNQQEYLLAMIDSYGLFYGWLQFILRLKLLKYQGGYGCLRLK